MARLACVCAIVIILPARSSNPAAQSAHPTGTTIIRATDCTVDRLGAPVPTSSIGEPVRSVTLSAPSWVEAANDVTAHCRVNGSMASIDTNSTARPINFSVMLPATWPRRAAQLGGAGMNGFVPNLTGGGPRGGGPRGVNLSDDWALNDDAIRNLGYLQMKKTRDAAMVIIEHAYRERLRYNYYIGTSQGGREALAVAQRYPADYDGIAANVPIVRFSSLMLAPELIRIQEKPQANDQVGLLFDWVENNVAPGMSVTVTADDRSLPLCSYPSYPRYRSGPAGSASSYLCSTASPITK